MKCKVCNIDKYRHDYYSSNFKTCKECIKQRSKERHNLLKQDSDWLEKERARGREKYHRLNYKDKHKPSKENKKKVMYRYKNKYPEKQSAKNATQVLGKEFGGELHHWSYNEEDWKDCIELSVEDHNLLHRFLIYDQDTFYYKDLEGNLLDTKEKHLNLYYKLFE